MVRAAQTDLKTAAAGGFSNPAAGRSAPAPSPAGIPRDTPQGALVDDTPFLGDPTNRPDVPITDGLSRGPGAGPEALANGQGTNNETIMQYLPQLQALAARDDAPPAFRGLVTYLARGSN